MSRAVIGLGISAGISAYKIVSLISKLRQEGYRPIPVLTTAAREFVSPLVLKAVSGERVYSDQFDLENDLKVDHIDLARRCDIFLVAPATADIIAKMATGQADELLLALILAAEVPVFVAPAMNPSMFRHPSVQENIRTLERFGYKILGPTSGWTACGEPGLGRMIEPEDLFQYLEAGIGKIGGCLSGKKVLLTNGPTREHIDPMRYISNLSSGKMGSALVRHLLLAGADVTVVSGPVSITYPAPAEIVPVTTAQEMYASVETRLGDADIFFSVAAVSDYRPREFSSTKLPSGKDKHLPLEPNPDILQMVIERSGNGKFIVGFAAVSSMDTDPLEKLSRKPVDLLVANPVGKPGIGPGADNNDVKIYDRAGTVVFESTGLQKELVAAEIVRLTGEKCP